jgi:hypothetical protein
VPAAQVSRPLASPGRAGRLGFGSPAFHVKRCYEFVGVQQFT